MGKKTDTEWRKRVEREARHNYAALSIDWDDMVRHYEIIDSIMKSNNENQSVNNIISKIYAPVTGLYFTLETMRMWHHTVRKIRQVCVDDKKHLFKCPDNMTNKTRWLSRHEDEMLLLVTTLVIYEGPYKKIIDMLYDAAQGKDTTDTSTHKKAEYLAKEYKIGILDVIDADRRNSIAHVSFYPDPRSGIVKMRLGEKGKLLANYNYTHEKLVSFYTKIQDTWLLLHAAVRYWWELECGPMRLFGDEFFLADNGEAVRKTAVNRMLQTDNLNIEAWTYIVKRARDELVLKTN